MLVKVCLYWTNDHYHALAVECMRSLDKWGVMYEGRKVYAENWKHAVLQKPFFIYGMLQETEAEYLIYTDADSRLTRSLPAVGMGSNQDAWDIAYVPFKRSPHHETECLSGTMGFRKCPEVLEFLQAWGEKTETYKHTETPEQYALKDLLERTTLKIERWGPEWCWIFDDSKEIYGNDIAPIFEHYQASRTYKTKEKLQSHQQMPDVQGIGVSDPLASDQRIGIE